MSEICERIHHMLSNFERHHFPFDENEIPLNGIYLVFEDGERSHGTDRIVRVGTHTGENQLRSRLKQHFVNENKDRSIFRKNIGRALLQKANDPFLKQWEWDLTSREAKESLLSLLDVDRQKEVEEAVSVHIRQHLSFVVLQVASKEERLELEQKIISSISWCEQCGPSPDWLGLYSTKQKIRESGLWLVNGLYKEQMSRKELEMLEKMIVTG